MLRLGIISLFFNKLGWDRDDGEKGIVTERIKGRSGIGFGDIFDVE
jgi:hypothetical protein